VPETRRPVIVHHADGLHVRVDDCAAQVMDWNAPFLVVIGDHQFALAGHPALPLPALLLAALEHGLLACAGCALGFDRLAMLAEGAGSIEAVMTFVDQ
jgi:hypothetical protein